MRLNRATIQTQLGCCMITSKTKINVLKKIIILHSRSPPGTLHSKFKKNVDFTFEENSCIVLSNWTFFHVLAHCVLDVFHPNGESKLKSGTTI